MSTFEVSVVKTVCANIKVEAATAEEAEAKVREQFAQTGLRGSTWIDYETHEKDLNGFGVTWVEKLK